MIAFAIIYFLRKILRVVLITGLVMKSGDKTVFNQPTNSYPRAGQLKNEFLLWEMTCFKRTKLNLFSDHQITKKK